MSQAALAEPEEIKPTQPVNDKLESLRETVNSRFPSATFKCAKTSGGNALLYIEHENHCLRIERRFVGYGFTDIGDKENLSLGPDCIFKEDLPLLTRHVIHFLSSSRDR